MFRFTSVVVGTFAAILSLVGLLAIAAGNAYPSTQISFVGKTDQHDRLIVTDLERGIEVTLLEGRRINAHVWSADGSQLAVMMIHDGRRGLHLLDVVSGDLQLLLATSRGDYVRWSDDGWQVSFLENPYWRRVDLRTDAEVTFRTSLDENRMRSPDKAWTASIATNPDTSTTDIVIAPTGTRDFYRLTYHADAADALPRWSPDGNLLAFQRRQRDSAELSAWYVVPVSDFIQVAESNTMPIVPTPLMLTPSIPANSMQISLMPDSPWSTDSTQFLFTLTDTNAVNQPITHVYVVNADGTGLRQITHNPDRADTYPVWRP